MSPTQHSLKWLREFDFTAEVVERTLPHCPVKKDFLGFIDILACRPGCILGVQVTSTSNMAARLKKALASPHLVTWLKAGGHFEVHGWSKKGARGAVKRWTLNRREVKLEEALAAPLSSPDESQAPTDP